ncbi:MAG TPA: sugar phosphate isomerase/epimerase [Planctomycetaceae bacterium]|nr:sugar phosphate isomerase/epimerase [Planctomycetaceae bacterium]
MYVTASTHCFGDLSFADAINAIHDLEYDKVELWMDEASTHLKPSELAANPDRFIQQYRDLTRMTPVAMHIEHDPGREVFEGVCRLAKLMRITQITLPAGQLGTPFNEEIDRLRSRLATANAAGMRLSLKTKTGYLTEDPQTAVELCQAVPGLGITLDASYYISGKYANQSFSQVYPYVYHVHLRDTSKTAVQVPVGLGELDYSRIIAQLRRYNLARVLSVEILPELLEGSDRSLEMRKIRMLLESLL